MTETLRTQIPVRQHAGTWYTSCEGLDELLAAWAAKDPRRAVGGDEDVVISYWDDDAKAQKIDCRSNDVDVERSIGYGWSLFGLPFAVEVTQTVEDLDGTDDAADWIQAGHVLDLHEVEYIRGLVLPKTLVISNG